LGLNNVKQISEVDSVAKYVDFRGVEEIGVDIGSAAHCRLTHPDAFSCFNG
jgi:hypothetical protein